MLTSDMPPPCRPIVHVTIVRYLRLRGRLRAWVGFRPPLNEGARQSTTGEAALMTGL